MTKTKAIDPLRAILRMAAASLGCVLLICCCSANKVIFPAPPSSYVDDGRTFKLESEPGVEISALYMPKAGAEYTILYSHGNAEDIGELRGLFELYRSHGFEVFAYDYRGYGTSQGRPSESGCHKDIEAAWRHLTGVLKIPPERIIVYGRSVGSGPAVWLASREKPAGLVVESGFKSAFSVVSGWGMPFIDRFPNIDLIGKAPCPVMAIHGTKDEVVPFSHGEALYAAAPKPKVRYWVEGAGHNDLILKAGDSYWSKLSAFAESLEQSNGKRAIFAKAPRRGDS